MASLKKYFLIGMIAIVLLSAGLMVLAKLGEEPAVNNNVVVKNTVVAVNNTVVANMPTVAVIADDVSGFETSDNPKIANADIFFKINAKGNDNISFKVSSFALQDSFFKKWYILNSKSTEIGEVSGNVSADISKFFNKIYVYIPEVSVNINGSEKSVSMPSNKMYIDGDFMKTDANQSAYFELTFLKDDSLFENSDGTLVFAPKIRVESFVNVTGSNPDSGKLWMNITVGMDNNGTVRSGLEYTPE